MKLLLWVIFTSLFCFCAYIFINHTVMISNLPKLSIKKIQMLRFLGVAVFLKQEVRFCLEENFRTFLLFIKIFFMSEISIYGKRSDLEEFRCRGKPNLFTSFIFLHDSFFFQHLFKVLRLRSSKNIYRLVQCTLTICLNYLVSHPDNCRGLSIACEPYRLS